MDFNYFISIFEDSNLSQIGIPKQMISAIHQKPEHYSEKYPRMGHTYKAKSAVPMPYKYHRPSPEIEIPEPAELRGWTSTESPFNNDTDDTGKLGNAEYTDLIWFLRSLPYGENRAFIVHPEYDLFVFIYNKKRSVGAVGSQYAVIAWDSVRQKAIDFGFSEMTTRSVDLGDLRKAHLDKGGNTAGKVQEFIKARIKGFGGKKWAANRDEESVSAYVMSAPADFSQGAGEPRETRLERESSKTNSTDFVRVVANKLGSMYPKTNANLQARLSAKAESSYALSSAPGEILSLAEEMGSNPMKIYGMLFTEFRDFRQKLYNAGRAETEGALSAYSKTPGFDLEKENQEIQRKGGGWYHLYQVSTKKFSPDEEQREPETGAREAQPDKFRRQLPVAGEYASIPSMIRKHTLDGIISKFIAYLFTGKVKDADVSLGALLGIKAEEFEDPFKTSQDDDIESWLA
jgi:hypothetical protein